MRYKSDDRLWARVLLQSSYWAFVPQVCYNPPAKKLPSCRQIVWRVTNLAISPFFCNKIIGVHEFQYHLTNFPMQHGLVASWWFACCHTQQDTAANSNCYAIGKVKSVNAFVLFYHTCCIHQGDIILWWIIFLHYISTYQVCHIKLWILLYVW